MDLHKLRSEIDSVDSKIVEINTGAGRQLLCKVSCPYLGFFSAGISYRSSASSCRKI